MNNEKWIIKDKTPIGVFEIKIFIYSNSERITSIIVNWQLLIVNLKKAGCF